MPRQTFAVTVESWRALLASWEEAGLDLPEAGQHRERLKAMFERVYQLEQERAALEAAKQVATQEIRDILQEGQKTANYLRAALKLHYGNRSEELVAFGMKPLRTRPRARKKPVSKE